MLGGTGLNDASVGPLLVSEEEKLAYLRTEGMFALGRPILGSITMTNSITASYMAYEGLRYLIGLPLSLRAVQKHIDFTV